MTSVSPAKLVITEFDGRGVKVYTYANLKDLLEDVITNRGPDIPEIAKNLALKAIELWKKDEEENAT